MWFLNKYFLAACGIIVSSVTSFYYGYTVREWKDNSAQLKNMNDSFVDLQKNLNNAIIKTLQINEQQNEIIFEKNERLAKMQKSVEGLHKFLAGLTSTGCDKLDAAHVQLLHDVTEVANRKPGEASPSAHPSQPNTAISKSRDK